MHQYFGFFAYLEFYYHFIACSLSLTISFIYSSDLHPAFLLGILKGILSTPPIFSPNKSPIGLQWPISDVSKAMWGKDGVKELWPHDIKIMTYLLCQMSE